MPENEQAQNLKPKRRLKFPKIFKNPYFVFFVILGLFILSMFVLLVIDDNNALRHQVIPALDGLSNWLRQHGLTHNVQMTTWFIFIFLFVVLFAIFFIRLFHKKLLESKRVKNELKTGEPELSPQQKRKFNAIFFLVIALVAIALMAGGSVIFIVKNYFPIIGQQLGDFGQQALSFLITFSILLALLLSVPVAIILLMLVFKLIVTIISLFVSGVSNSVMRSEGYQQNVAASQAAAHDIERSMAEARGLSADAVARAHGRGGSGGGSQTPQADVIFPALTNIDMKWEKIEEEKRKAEEEAKAAEEARLAALQANEAKPIANPDEVEALPEEPKDENARPPLDYEQFKLLAYEFQSYLCHQKYYFKINTLRSFIAGLAAARLILLQGLSGTGKSTLPRVFLEYIGGDAYFFPVQATWRDRSDITGYYSDFTGQFKETELLKHLYEASYIPETCNLMVLDEMNISRVEYYFADFLSIFEYPSEDWVVPLMQVKPGTVLPKYIENGMVRIPTNTWFVGTVNIDDSTFTITDKVYDRAIAIDFSELNLPFESNYRYDTHPIKIQELTAMFQECKDKPENRLTPAERKKFLDLTQFISETFDIQFGNRIMNQIDNFLPVFVGLGGTKNEALDVMVARKVLRKLEGKFESYIKDGLNKLTRYINSSYGKHVFPESEAVIEKYRKKLS